MYASGLVLVAHTGVAVGFVSVGMPGGVSRVRRDV